MKQKWLILIMALVCLPMAYGDKCEDVIDVGQTCTMITPVINCTNYTYSVTNETGNITSQGNLLDYEGDKYYFTFNETKGGYVVELCDGSTREITVRRDELVVLATMFGIGIIIGLLLFLASRLNEEHIFLKGLLVIFALITVTLIPSALILDTDSLAPIFTKLVFRLITVFGAYTLIYLIYQFTQRSEKWVNAISVVKSSFKRK